MKLTGQDMALLIEEPDELLDAELAGMFPKGRTRIANTVMMVSSGVCILVSKDDIALAEKRREETIRLLLTAAYCGAIACIGGMVLTHVLHPFIGLPVIGAAVMIMAALSEMKKRRPQKHQF